MDCLNNYIGLSGCGSTTPDSGLYLNDLPGIELRQVDEIANEEQQNYVGVWAAVQKRALKMFEKDLRVAFTRKYKLKGITQNINIGKIIDTTSTIAAATQMRGAAIELNEASDTYVDSNFQVVFIQSVRIYVPGVKTFDFKIYDLDTAEELYAETITTTASGWEVININDYYLSSRRLFIAYDCSTIDSVKLDLNNFELNCWERCKARVRGAYSDLSDPTALTYSDYNTNGLSVTFSTQCKFDTVVCNNKDIFAQSLLYLLGAEFLLEQLNSSRVNKWTMLDNKQAKYLRGYYLAMYKGGIFEEQTYDGEIIDAVELVNIKQDDCCIDCIGKISFQDVYI